MTDNETAIISAIENGYTTFYEIAKQTQLEHWQIGDAIANLTNNGIIKQVKNMEWELSR